MNVIRIQGEPERYQGIYYEYDRDSTPLGEGGMGRIYQGFRVDEMSNFRIYVAIKEIRDDMARDPQLIERAMRESSIQIVHENLLRMYGFVSNVEYDPLHDANIVRYYMIMERLVGVNLDQVLKGVTTDKSGMQIPFAQELYELYNTDRDTAVIRIMRGVLSGIMALHEKGYIHRDIDPSNIMITIDGKIKLIDFGVCKHIEANVQEKKLTSAGSFLGKVNYAAPELALGDIQHQNRTTDIYALGILIYQLCVGHLPFSGSDQEVLAAQVSKKVPVGDILNKDIRKIVEKATQKQQSKRYQNGAEFIVDLERVHPRTKTGRTNAGNMNAQSYELNSSAIAWWLWPVTALAGLAVGLLLNIVF